MNQSIEFACYLTGLPKNVVTEIYTTWSGQKLKIKPKVKRSPLTSNNLLSKALKTQKEYGKTNTD